MPYIPVAFIGRLCMIPIAPTRDRNSTGHTERTDGRLCAAPGGSGIHAFAFLPIRYSFLNRTCLQPPSPKTVLKVFHLYRYKKSEKLSPENQIFQKKFESCRNSSQKRKKKVILLYRTAEDQTSNRERKWNSLPTACCFLQLKQGTYLIRLNIEKCYHIER